MLALTERVRTTAVILGAIVLLQVFVASAFAQTEGGGDLRQHVKSAMHLRDFKLQSISAMPVQGRGIVTVPLTLDGQTVSLKLVSHSLRAPNFQMYTRGAGGVLTPVIAPVPTTYRGQVIGHPEASVSASIVNGKWSMQIADGEMTWWVQPLSDAFVGKNAPVDPQQYIVYKQSDLELDDGVRCGLSDAEHIGHRAAGGAALAPGLPGGCLKQAEIACDSDFEYFTLNGSDAAATTLDIESIINGMDFIYRRDCGITYLITAIIVQTVEPDPYSATGYSALLPEFQNYWLANQTAIVRDVAHLFTGKDIDPGPGGVIGVAYLPGVCTAANGYGLSESKFSATVTFAKRVNLTAHELGHNWNALHCNQTNAAQPCANPLLVDCGIMCSSLSGCSQLSIFESCSAGAITAYRDSLTCLGLAAAPVWTTAALSPTDVLGSDRYGTSVCISGNLAIVGAGSDDVTGVGTDEGSAYIYRFDGTTWIEEVKLINPTPWARPTDRFGTSVAITSTDHGDVAVVGAYLWDFVNENQTTQRSSGVAYVYRKTGATWFQTPEARLIPIDHAGGDLFGLSVSIDGDLIGVGAQFNDDHGANSGSAYIFRYAGGSWTQEAKLVPADGLPGDNFGIYIDVQEGVVGKGLDDAAVIGAWADDDAINGVDSGSAYVYRKTLKTGWVIEQKLTANDGAASDRFGTSVAISGNVVIVGAPFDDDPLGTTNVGSAYVFHRGVLNWTQVAKLSASDAAINDQFGYSVAVDADAAIVGAYLHDSGATSNTGQAYIFRNSGASWIQESILTGPIIAEDQFGYSVSISNGVSMVGAWLSDNAGPVVDGGSVYIGTTGGAITDCNLNLVPDACDIAAGTSLDVNVNGIPDECEVLNTCPADVSNPPNGVVDIDDLVMVIINWGACPLPCPPVCPGDVTQNCVVDIDDLVALIITWGNCPTP